MSCKGILITFGVQDTITGAHIKKGELCVEQSSCFKILVHRGEGNLGYSFIIIIIYLLKAGGFFFLVDALNSWFQGGGEDRVAGTVVSCLLAAKAKTFLNTNLLFLWGELPDIYSIYIHSVWVLGSPGGGRGEVRACRRRGDFVVFGSSGYNLTGLVPLGLEPFSFGVPFINGGGY